MRIPILLYLSVCVTACDQAPIPGAPKQRLAALTFDGADAADAPARLAHGKRLATVLGCQGCHGKDLTGKNFTADEPEFGIFFASNLTRALPDYTDEEFERLMRSGVHRVRAQLWIMPSETFQHLGDADLESLLAYLRSLPSAGERSPVPVLGPKAKAEIAGGSVKPADQLVREWKASPPVDLGPGHALGRYVASVTCAECHGPALAGDEGDTPDLDIAGAYSTSELQSLLTTGKGKAPRDLGLMAKVGKNRFSQLTPRERSAVIAYVKARAERPQ